MVWPTTAIRFLLVIVVTACGYVCPGVVVAQESSTGVAGGSGGSMFDRDPEKVDEQMIAWIKDQPLPWMFGLNFMVVNPQDSLRRAYQQLDAPSVGYGFAFDVAYYMDPIPVAITGQFAVNFVGMNSQTYRTSSPSRDEYRLETQNVQLPVTIGVRFQPNLYNRFFPYVEGVGGFSLFSTSAEVRPTDNGNGTVVSGPQPETTASWVYGVGLGTMITIAEIITLPIELERVAIDIRCRYLWSTDVQVPAYQLESTSYTIERVSVPSPHFVFVNIGLIGHF